MKNSRITKNKRKELEMEKEAKALALVIHRQVREALAVGLIFGFLVAMIFVMLGRLIFT